MSLINEALKKAQKERSGEAPPLSSIPGIGGERATQIAGRNRPAGASKFLISLGLGAGALIAIIAGLVIWLRQPASPAPVGKPAEPALAVAPVAKPPAVSSQPVINEPLKPFVLPIPAATSPAPVASAPAPAADATTATTATTKAATPAVPGKFNLQGITFIESLRVTGIRASETDSKVLMNDRVYRPGDIVEHAIGIKLVAITSSALTFEDENGARYVRQF